MAGLDPSGELRQVVGDCVHCGFCLTTCPTYQLWGEEMDSPRGRIHLMSALVDGSLPLTDTVVEHFDRCLGCMACVTACPSGVQYDRLIEQTRVVVEERGRRTITERLLR
ncbi:MAG TPA: 4Fe-4S dicluster domain-containing protein, partial [Streptosporangiaceae bacterium]|nr:4Fe-4S dicluster domain-containing protein [Streptosporangiaceae bacterium]